jgi:group I intron endonuclease
MIIYKTINSVNGKIYVGKDFYNNPNYIGSGLLLKNAIKKYGIDKFKKEILEKCFVKEDWIKREIYWIERLNSTNRDIGYNIAKGGCGGDCFSNHPKKEEIRKKFQKFGDKNTMYRKPWPEERKERVRLKLMGRKFLEGSLIKRSQSLRGPNNPMYQIGDKHPFFGKRLTKKHKIKISESLKIFWENNPECKKSLKNNFRNSKGSKGRSLSEVHKLKISMSNKGNSGPNLGKKFSEESRKKNSESQKLRYAIMSNEQKAKINLKKQKIRLSQECIKKRIELIKNIDKKRGWITRIAKDLNISHAQVRRFIKKFYSTDQLNG